jgi:hypothetical protein
VENNKLPIPELLQKKGGRTTRRTAFYSPDKTNR